MTDKKDFTNWTDELYCDDYAHRIFRLQKDAKLTFKEARAVLSPQQATKEFADEWGTTEENVYNMRRRGWNKINKFTSDKDERADLAPTIYWWIF